MVALIFASAGVTAADVFNVREYGARGDDSSDDTVAIREAIEAAASKGGGTIYFPTGVYRVAPQATDASWAGDQPAIFQINSGNLTFQGDGPGKSIISAYTLGLAEPVDTWTVIGDGNGYFKIKRGGAFLIMSRNGPIENVTFRGLRVTGNAPATGNSSVGGIPETGDGWDMSHKGLAIHGGNTIDNILIENCHFDHWRGEAIYSGSHAMRRVVIRDSKIYETNSSAISMSASVTVENCEMWNVYNGFENYALPGQYSVVRNTIIEPNRSLPKGGGKYGVVYLGGAEESLLVEDSVIRNADNAAIFLSDFADNVTIKNNLIEDCPIGVYAIYLNLYQKPSSFKNILIEGNRFHARARSCEALVTRYIGGPANNWIIRRNEVRGFNGYRVGSVVRSTHPGPWDLIDDFILEENSIEGGLLLGDAKGFRPILLNNSVLDSRQGQYYNSYSGTALDPITVNPLNDAVFNDIESDGKRVLVNDLDKLPVGFEFSMFSTRTDRGAEVKPDRTWNNLSRGYMIYKDSELRLRFNEQGVFEFVSYTPRSGSPLTVTKGDNITFRGFDSVNLAPGSATRFTQVSGLAINDPVTLNYNAKVTIAHTLTSPSQAFQISAPGGKDWTPGKSGSLQVVKLQDDVLYFLPAIQTQSTYRTVNEFSSTTLNMNAIGSGPMRYQWYAGAKGDTSRPVSGATSASFTTGQLTGDEAQYWVRVSNPAGSVDSDTMTVVLTPIAPVINTGAGSEPIRVQEFANASLSIDAYGSGDLSYQWYRGKSGDTSSLIEGATGATLEGMQMLGVGEQDFWARVTNAQGAIDSGTITVDVEPAPPYIVELSDNASVEQYARVGLSVTAMGSGEVTYQWFEGESGDPRRPVGGAIASTYTTAPLSGQSGFKFWVRVSNAQGSVDSDTISLSLPGLMIEAQAGSTAVKEFSGASLTIEASGVGPISYQWYRGVSGDTRSPISGATGATLQTGELQGLGNLDYWVRVTNASGYRDSETVTVTVEPVEAEFTVQPESGSIGPQMALTLSADATGSGPIQYQWLRNGVAIPGATGKVLTIAEFSEAHAGDYVARATNPAGSVDSEAARITLDERTDWMLVDPINENSLENWLSVTPRLQGTDLQETKALADVSPRKIAVVDDLYLGPSSRVLAFSPGTGEWVDGAVVLPQNDNLSMSSLYLRFRVGEGMGDSLRLSVESVDGEGLLFDAIDLNLERTERGLYMDIYGERELLLEDYVGWIDAWLLIDNQRDTFQVIALPGHDISYNGLNPAAPPESLGEWSFQAPVSGGFTRLLLSASAGGATDDAAAYVDNVAYVPQGQRVERPVAVSLWDHLPTVDGTGWKDSGIGWIYDSNYPWVWHSGQGYGAWFWINEASVLPNIFLYDMEPSGFWRLVWTSEYAGRWNYRFGGGISGWNWFWQ